MIKMYNEIDPDDKRIVQGTGLIIAGTIMMMFNLPGLFFMITKPFSLGLLRFMAFSVLGIALILTGTFTLVQWITRTGRIVIGLTSTMMGVILLLFTSLMIIGILKNIWGASGFFLLLDGFPSLVSFLISGTGLLLHGLILIIKKQKSMKIVSNVIFILIGISLIVWVSRSLYLDISFKSPIFSPIYTIAIDLNIFIVGIASLITCFFIINPFKRERSKLLMGIISIIFGGVIMIISTLGELNIFNI